MQAKGLFPTYHPAVVMLYFLAAIIFSFCTMQPIYVGISAIMACVYLVFLKGVRSLLTTVAFCLPFMLLIAILNSFFNTAGATNLFEIGPFSLTLEALCYGVFIGLMILSVLVWFSCYSTVMTDDKFTYLFGRAFPSLSLLISMVSRWVPSMAQRGRVVWDSQEALIGGYDQSNKGRFNRGVRLASVLAGLGMEDSIQTSDSMRARGYGVGKRTSYSQYAWHMREFVVLGLLVVLIVVNAMLMFHANGEFAYYPTLSILHLWWGYIPYVIMLALPFIVELEEVAR